VVLEVALAVALVFVAVAVAVAAAAVVVVGKGLGRELPQACRERLAWTLYTHPIHTYNQASTISVNCI
jgi:Na+-driven multidrug efflux pump